MPTYSYRCKHCSHQFEELQRISEAPLVECPVCHTRSLVRLIEGGAGLVFKGSGFYLTDYKKQSSSTSTPAHSSHHAKKPGPKHKTESKSESKTEPKTESRSEPSASEKNDSHSGDPK